MAIDKQQVKELLGTGLSVSIVASAVGCTDSYVTQLLGDEDFAADVARLKIVSLQQERQRDAGIDKIEDRLIKRLDDAVEGGLFWKPHDLLNAFKILNAAKRRGASVDNTHVAPATVINLTIPAAVSRRFTINPQGEVLQVDDQTLVTMPTGQLLREMGERTGEKAKYESVRNRIMAAVQNSDNFKVLDVPKVAGE